MDKKKYITPRTKTLWIADELMAGTSVHVHKGNKQDDEAIDDPDDILAKPDGGSVWDGI